MPHVSFVRARVCSPGTRTRTVVCGWVAALGFAGFSSVPTAAAQQAIELREVRQNLLASCMPSDTNGWMVGELGRIFHTADGGKSWERQNADTKRPLLSLACVDSNDAWLASTQGVMYHTTNAGKTWGKVDTGSTTHVFALQFPTAMRGHGAGDFGHMIHTEDGGKTWTKQGVPTDTQLPESALDTGVDPGDVNLYGLSYGTPELAWLVGEFGISLHTTDGGLTWKQQKTPVETTLFGVFFKDATTGWAVGGDATILHTEDGGVTWNPQHSPVVARPFFDVVVRGQTGWIVGEAGTILKSNDAGLTWQVQDVPIQLAARWLRSVVLSPSGKGLAVGAEGLVFRLDGLNAERIARRADESAS